MTTKRKKRRLRKERSDLSFNRKRRLQLKKERDSAKISVQRPSAKVIKERRRSKNKNRD